MNSIFVNMIWLNHFQKTMQVASLLILIQTLQVNCKEYKLGLLLPGWAFNPGLGWEVNAAAATMALEQAEKDGILNGNTIRLILRDDECDERTSPGEAVSLKCDQDIDGFIGLPCSSATTSTAYLASYWNLPIFSQSASQLNDKKMFNTLVRMGYSLVRLAEAIAEVFSYFEWKQFVMITTRAGRVNVLCDYSANTIEEQFRYTSVNLADWIVFDAGLSSSEIDDILMRAKQRGRIIVFCGIAEDEQHFLMRFHKLNLVKDEFLFMTVYNTPPSYITQAWQFSTPYSQDPILRTIYRNVIQISVPTLEGPEIGDFLEQIPIKMSESPWFYNKTLESGKKGSIFALYLYDAMYLYCVVLNETLSQGGDPRNGTLMFNNAKFKTFNDMTCQEHEINVPVSKSGQTGGINGPVTMDENGDKLPKFWLWHMNKDGSSFEVWSGIKLSRPRGQRLKITTESTWNTKDGSTPRDIPVCGFMNESCHSIELKVLIPVLLTCLILAIISASIIILLIRRAKHKNELEKMLWRLNCTDLNFIKAHKRLGSLSSVNIIGKAGSVKSLKSTIGSVHDIASTIGNTIDTPGKSCALLNGDMVAIDHIKVNNLSLTHNEKVELNAMRQMNHENLNQFIGMCIESEIYIVAAFCSRGTLQDVLDTDEIKLDMSFKKSLLQDLVNGVLYIHNSSLNSHGHLTSDNCTIDNHWVLKITSFGIQRIRGLGKEHIKGTYQKYRDLLWTAPEILRQAEDERSPNGTKGGDVYSVGIIMQEVLYRCMPYGDNIDPEEIIETLLENKDTNFRPDIATLNTNNDSPPEKTDIDLMKSCWSEAPSDRPKITALKKIISQSQKGRSVIDNMLAIMEKYANNLEEIVESRTVELVEEKKKTDVLLYSMLPKEVADQLKSGGTIEPEMYESVTIFFSDIVGFTQLSSESTPIQVIYLLNDLYTLFDDIIKQHDVYKVETIGDAYMIVSGLPKRNDNKHASEIANTALDLLHAVTTQFKVQHKPDLRLFLRIGLHTGPCAAGVVGLTMPRYCLFGDTVNTASRMESNGEALKIHISGCCNDILHSIGGFKTEERGEIEMKGKGTQTTYWLLGTEEK